MRRGPHGWRRGSWALMSTLAASPALGGTPAEDQGFAVPYEPIILEYRRAFSEGDLELASGRLAALLARDDLSDADRLWALQSRAVLLDRQKARCALVGAIDEYLAAAADVPSEAVTRRREARRRAQAIAACEASRRPPPAQPPSPPAPVIPPRGRGTIVVGSGALLVDPHGFSPARALVAAEGSLGLVWPNGFQLEGALALSLESLILRPGMRLDLFEIVEGGCLQLRLGGQLMMVVDDALRIGGGVLGGLGALVPIDGDFGLLGALEASLWPSALYVSLDGRLGVYFAF